MQQIKANIYFLTLVSVLFLISCNQPAGTSDKNDKDTSQAIADRDTSLMPVYDPAMEPLTVGAKMSKKLGDTLGVKMYEFAAKPGESCVASPKFKTVWKTTELLTLNSQNLYEKETFFRGADDQSNQGVGHRHRGCYYLPGVRRA